MKIILASLSPRRAEILETIGAVFEVCPANVDECVPRTFSPAEAVCEISRRKAVCVLERFRTSDVLVLAADTVVAARGEILGKPKDEKDAERMLRLLSGASHEVYTGYTLCTAEKVYTAYESTAVQFRALSDDEIYRYIKSGEPADKAGAYGIQEKGAAFVTGIHGDFFNVMGLPVCAVTLAAREQFGAELVGIAADMPVTE